MPAKITSVALLGALVGAIASSVAAQEGGGTPIPSVEMKKLEPLLGNWAGSGTVADPKAGTSKWKGAGSYRWSHDGFWVQEDFKIEFETMAEPLVFRGYLGWDAENRRFVNCHVANTGEVGVSELEMQPDGSFLSMMIQWDGGSFAERASFKIDGDTMTERIEFLMGEGKSIEFVKGTFTRVDAEVENVLAAGAFAAPANEEMQRLDRGAGVYDTKGSMIMMPGAPAMKITGTDTFTAIFGGKVLHGRTEGAAEGMPGKYVSDGFWGWDKRRGRYVAVYVSNMGEVGQMDMFAGADGKSLVSTMAGTMAGSPMVQRFVLEHDADGHFTRGTCHSIFGTTPPFESFSATYTRK